MMRLRLSIASLLLLISVGANASTLDNASANGVVQDFKGQEVVFAMNGGKYLLSRDFFNRGEYLFKGKVTTVTVPFEKYVQLKPIK